MTSMPPPTPGSAGFYMPPESWPNYDLIITEDGKPVESVYAEKQMRLLSSVLNQTWSGPGEGRPFLASSNVGVFYSFNEPPIVPDVFLSLDVRWIRVPTNKSRSYFVWEYGKPPDAAVEIVSLTEGGELTTKLEIYEKIGIPYYIVWDPDRYLSEKPLHCFIRQGSKYTENGTWFPQIGLGVTTWEGEFENEQETWLRWCDQNGVVLPTGLEKITLETQRAEQEKQRAEKLAEKLRALGVDPNQP